MSAINNSEFDFAISRGLKNFYEERYAIEAVVSNTFSGTQNLVTVDSTGNSNPFVGSGNDWQRNGTVANGGNSKKIWTSDTNSQTLQQFRVQLKATSNDSFSGFAVWNGPNSNGFGESLQVGSQIEIENYGIDCKRDGIAEALVDGEGVASGNALSYHVYLLDNNGARITTSGWADAVDPQPVTADSSSIRFDDTVSFTNTSGSGVTVDGVEVVYDASNNLIIKDTSSFNVFVGDGATIELTTLKVNLTLP